MSHSSQSYPGTREYYNSRTLPESQSRQKRILRIEELRKKFLWMVNSEIMAQMPEDIRVDLADEDTVLDSPWTPYFLLKKEYSLSEWAARIEHILSRPFRREWQLLVDISTDPVYQLLSEIVEAIPEAIAERWDEMNRVSFPATEATRQYEFESTVDVVLNKVQEWQHAIISRDDLSEFWEDGDSWNTETIYTSLLRASGLSHEQKREFIKELILAIPQWMGGKIYWQSIDDICSKVLSPKTESESVWGEWILRDEDVPF